MSTTLIVRLAIDDSVTLEKRVPYRPGFSNILDLFIDGDESPELLGTCAQYGLFFDSELRGSTATFNGQTLADLIMSCNYLNVDYAITEAYILELREYLAMHPEEQVKLIGTDLPDRIYAACGGIADVAFFNARTGLRDRLNLYGRSFTNMSDAVIRSLSKICAIDGLTVREKVSLKPVASTLWHLDAATKNSRSGNFQYELASPLEKTQALIGDAELSVLTDLQTLDASNNPCIKCIDSFAPKLLKLNASGYFCGIDDVSLFRARALEELNIDKNLKVKILRRFASTLRKLTMTLDQAVPFDRKQLLLLRRLFEFNCTLGRNTPFPIDVLPQLLQKLSIVYDEIPENTVYDFTPFSHLRTLKIRRSIRTWAPYDTEYAKYKLTALPELRSLEIDVRSLPSRTTLKDFKSLLMLKLNTRECIRDSWYVIPPLPDTITHLNINGIDVGDEDLKDLKHVKVLSMSGVRRVTTVNHFAKTLRVLDASGMSVFKTERSGLTDAGMSDILHLEKLNIRYTCNVRKISHFAQTLKCLNATFSELPNSELRCAENLEELSMVSHSYEDDDDMSLMDELSCWKTLRRLNVHSNRFTSAAINKCVNLDILHVDRLDDGAIFPRLKELLLYPNVDDAIMHARFPNLERLFCCMRYGNAEMEKYDWENYWETPSDAEIVNASDETSGRMGDFLQCP